MLSSYLWSNKQVSMESQSGKDVCDVDNPFKCRRLHQTPNDRTQPMEGTKRPSWICVSTLIRAHCKWLRLFHLDFYLVLSRIQEVFMLVEKNTNTTESSHSCSLLLGFCHFESLLVFLMGHFVGLKVHSIHYHIHI